MAVKEPMFRVCRVRSSASWRVCDKRATLGDQRVAVGILLAELRSSHLDDFEALQKFAAEM